MRRAISVWLFVGACTFETKIPVDPEPPISDLPDPIPLRCPSGYQTLAGSSYRLIDVSRSFRTHYDDCRDDGAGTHLVVIDTIAERDLVLATFGPEIWIGVVQTPGMSQPAGGWTTITGQAMSPMLWESENPDDDDDVEDGEQNVARLDDDGIDDKGASDSSAALCECDGARIDPSVEAYVP